MIRLLVTFLSLATVAYAAPESLSWSSREFQQQFLASYGFDGPREPKIVPAEQLVLQALVPLMESGQYTVAANQLKSSITPESSAALDYTLGNLYRQTGEIALAESAYRAALQKMPGFVRAAQNLGLLLLQNGRAVEAIQPLTTAIARGSEEPSVLGALAYCHYEEGDYAAALIGYEKAAFLAPDNADWQLGRAQCLIQLDRIDEALASAERYLRNHPNHAPARRIAINACLAEKDWERAAAHLELLRRQDQADAATLLLLGRAYLSMDLPDLATKAFLESLNREQQPATEDLLAAAELLAQQGNLEQTETLLTFVYQKYGDNLSGQAMNQLLRLQGRLKMRTGELNAAARLLEQAALRDPLDGRTLLLLGQIEFAREHLADAQIAYERASKLEPVAADAWLELARLHVSQRQWKEAIEALEQAQRIRPDTRVTRYLESVRRASTL